MRLSRPKFAVSAGHPLAAEITADVLRNGGNAVDAGAAAAIALTVLHCEKVQLGGIAPMMLRMGPGAPVQVIDGVGRWPAATDAALFRSQHRGRIPLGILRSVVPAAPVARILALRHFGIRGLAGLAAEGFPVHARMVSVVTGIVRFLAAFPENRRIWLPGGKPPVPGAPIRFPDLAATLLALIDADRAGAARGSMPPRRCSTAARSPRAWPAMSPTRAAG